MPPLYMPLEHLQQPRYSAARKKPVSARAAPGLARRAAPAPAAALKCSARASLQQRAKMQRARLEMYAFLKVEIFKKTR